MRDDLDIPYPAAGSAASSAYTPRDYRGTGRMDPNTRRMAIIAGGIGGALVLLLGVWSLTGHKHTGVPVIEADSRPVRERPVNKGGLAVTGADETIMSGDAEGKTVVAPEPESPAIAALKATPPAAAQPGAAQAGAVPSAVADGSPALPPVPQARTAQQDAPAATRAVASAPVRAAQAPAPALPVPAAKPPVAVGGGMQVQLAAVSSEEAAKGEWQRLSHKYPDLLASRRPAVSRTEHDGKVFWRLRVSGFTDPASATSFCGQLRSKGGACALASF